MTPRKLTFFQVGDIFASSNSYGNGVFKVLRIEDTEDYYKLIVKDFETESETELGFAKATEGGDVLLCEEYFLLVRP